MQRYLTLHIEFIVKNRISLNGFVFTYLFITSRNLNAPCPNRCSYGRRNPSIPLLFRSCIFWCQVYRGCCSHTLTKNMVLALGRDSATLYLSSEETWSFISLENIQRGAARQLFWLRLPQKKWGNASICHHFWMAAVSNFWRFLKHHAASLLSTHIVRSSRGRKLRPYWFTRCEKKIWGFRCGMITLSQQGFQEFIASGSISFRPDLHFYHFIKPPHLILPWFPLLSLHQASVPSSHFIRFHLLSFSSWCDFVLRALSSALLVTVANFLFACNEWL